MRKTLSPLMRQIAAYVQANLPRAKFVENLYADSLFLFAGAADFSISPPTISHDSVAAWPIYVVPVPSAEGKTWECHTLADVLEAVQWPTLRPSVRAISAAEFRARSGFGEARAPVPLPWAAVVATLRELLDGAERRAETATTEEAKQKARADAAVWKSKLQDAESQLAAQQAAAGT